MLVKYRAKGSRAVCDVSRLLLQNQKSSLVCMTDNVQPKNMSPDAEKDLRQLKTTKPFSEMPGPRGLPIIGNAMKYSKLGEI